MTNLHDEAIAKGGTSSEFARAAVIVVALMFLLACSETDRLRIRAYIGDSDAQIKLAMAYATGEGATEDDAQAFEWIHKAAEQGNSEAQFVLGLIYDMGKGVSEDDAQAAEWYRKAAEQGHAKAQVILGIAYYKGEGVPKDLVQAHMWKNLAAASGNESARTDLTILEGNMTEEQRAEAEKLAREWFEAHRVEKE
jgi:hypothetical protein